MRKPSVRWREEWNSLLGTMPDATLAKQLDVAHWTVLRHRIALGVRLKKFAVVCADCGKALKRTYMKKEAVCPKCKAKRNYQKQRPQKILAARAWRKANKVRARAYFAAWRERNRAHVLRYNRRWERKQRIIADETLGELPCLDCGMHHTAERRAAILRRMLPADAHDIREAWSCVWGEPSHRGTAKERLLYRDLEALGASHPPGTLTFQIRSAA